MVLETRPAEDLGSRQGPRSLAVVLALPQAPLAASVVRLGGPPGNPVAGASWSPVDAIQAAFQLIKDRPAEVLIPLIVAIVASSLPGVVGGFIGGIIDALVQASEEPALAIVSIGFRLLMQIVNYVVLAFITAGMFTFGLKVLRGEPASFGDVFSGGRHTLPIFGSFILVGLVVIVGLVLCFVPGIIAAIGLSMTSALIVDQDLGPIEAMKESWRITTGHKLNLFVYGLLAALVLFVGFLACCVGLFVANPIVVLANLWIYRRLSGR